MKKLLLILTMLVMMLPSMCFADPVIKSDSRTFNPLTGVYDLQGNVFVQFPAHDTTLTITGPAKHIEGSIITSIVNIKSNFFMNKSPLVA